MRGSAVFRRRRLLVGAGVAGAGAAATARVVGLAAVPEVGRRLDGAAAGSPAAAPRAAQLEGQLRWAGVVVPGRALVPGSSLMATCPPGGRALVVGGVARISSRSADARRFRSSASAASPANPQRAVLPRRNRSGAPGRQPRPSPRRRPTGLQRRAGRAARGSAAQLLPARPAQLLGEQRRSLSLRPPPRNGGCAGRARALGKIAQQDVVGLAVGPPDGHPRPARLQVQRLVQLLAVPRPHRLGEACVGLFGGLRPPLAPAPAPAPARQQERQASASTRSCTASISAGATAASAEIADIAPRAKVLRPTVTRGRTQQPPRRCPSGARSCRGRRAGRTSSPTSPARRPAAARWPWLAVALAVFLVVRLRQDVGYALSVQPAADLGDARALAGQPLVPAAQPLRARLRACPSARARSSWTPVARGSSRSSSGCTEPRAGCSSGAPPTRCRWRWPSATLHRPAAAVFASCRSRNRSPALRRRVTATHFFRPEDLPAALARHSGGSPRCR